LSLIIEQLFKESEGIPRSFVGTNRGTHPGERRLVLKLSLIIKMKFTYFAPNNNLDK